MPGTQLRGWRLLATGGLLLLVASCDAGLFGPAGEGANEPATLELGEHLSVVTELDTMTLSVIVRDEAGDVLDEGEVDWSSSETGIVSLEPTGPRSARAVANGPGMATIEVTHADLRAVSTIDVENLATGLREVTGSGQEAAAGEVLAEKLVVAVVDRRGDPVSGLVLDFSVSEGGGSLSPSSQATDAEGQASAVWTLGETGSQRVTVSPARGQPRGRAVQDSTVVFTATVPAPARVLLAIEVRPGAASLDTAGTQQFEAVGIMSDDARMPVPVSWSATGGDVDENGLYTAGAVAGRFRVIATHAEGFADSASVSVSAPATQVAEVTVSPPADTLAVGETSTFVATVRASDGTVLTDRVVAWQSADTGVATVDSTGTVTARGSGRATVTAMAGGVTGGAEVLVEDVSPPSAPTGLVASPASSSRIDLSWNEATDDVGVTGYRISRDGTRVADVSGITYSDTGLSAATTYTYRVAAFDAGDNLSDPSAPVRSTTESAGAPGDLEVTNLHVESGRNYQIDDSGIRPGAKRFVDRDYAFEDPIPSPLSGVTYIRTANADKDQNPGDLRFLSFDVNRAVIVYVAHDDRAALPTWLTDRFTDTGLDLQDTDGGSEDLSVYAANFPAGTITLGSNTSTVSGGASMYTVAIRADSTGISDTEAPTVPTGLNASAASTSRIDLSWRQSSDDVSVTGYYVYRDGSRVATVGDTIYADTGLTPSTAYTYRVAAHDAADNVSAESESASATTRAEADTADTNAPTAPSDLSAAAVSHARIDLNWSPSSDDVGVTGYFVYRDGSLVADVAETSYSDTGLSPSTTYAYRVSAYDEADNVSARADPVSATTRAVIGSGTMITTDPSNPRWLYHENGQPFFLAGTGGPEGFLYLGSRQADGTRSGGGQQQIINALAAANVNGLYMQAVRSHGGDGGGSHNPWLDGDPAQGLDNDILNQWEGWFDSMDAAGITIFFMFYDDDADPFGGSSMGGQEAAFIAAVVDRFKHHDHLIWVVAEEYREEVPALRVVQIAAEIRAGDPVHPIAVHQNIGTTFDFASDPSLDQFAMQLGDNSVDDVHASTVEAWRKAAGAYNVHMAELNNSLGHGEHTTAEIRQFNWAAVLGGAYVSVYRWWEPNAPSTTELDQLGYLQAFMASTRFDLMEPADSRATGETEWVLAHRTGLGNRYFIGYGRAVSSGLGFTGLDAGTYALTWLDTASGDSVTHQQTVPSDGSFTFARPAALGGSELALYVRKIDG